MQLVWEEEKCIQGFCGDIKCVTKHINLDKQIFIERPDGQTLLGIHEGG